MNWDVARIGTTRKYENTVYLQRHFWEKVTWKNRRGSRRLTRTRIEVLVLRTGSRQG